MTLAELDPALLPILVRMIAAATVVVLTSIVSEKAGPFWGAIIVALPVSAGPAYVLLALAQNADFVGASALMSLVTLAATAVYLLIYAHMAQRFSTLLCVAGSLLGWFIAALLAREVTWTPVSALVINAVAFTLCVYFTRNIKHPARVATQALRRWYDLPLRAAGVAVLVAALVTLSGLLGPVMTGIGAVFPVATTSVGLMLQPRLGGPAVSAIMADAAKAMPGMALGFLVLTFAAPQWGSAAGLSIALVASVIWPITLVVMRARRESRARAVG